MSVSAATIQESSGNIGRGRILTFYSYKGGTGRSMALANVAWMLALNNKRVLVIDWDLEAPGIHRYFHPFLEDKELQSTRGLIDFVEDLAARSAASPEPLADSEGDISSYVISLDRPGWEWEEFGDRAGIDLLVAGQQSAGYSRKVNCFNWISFYQNLGGRRYLAYMAAQLRGIYDYILIDSRTGVSDTSGICTVEMPDAVVVCFTLNEQSIRGAANVCESIVSQRNARDDERRLKLQAGEAPPVPLRIYPIPTRIEQSEYSKRQVALALVQKTFSRYLGDLSQAESRKYWGSLQMQYVPVYAFEEIPAVFGDSPYDQSSLSAFVGRLTRVLANDNSFSLQFFADDLRLQAFSWYQRPSEVALDSAQLAEAAFEQFGENLQREAIQVLLRLVQFTPSGVSPQVLARDDLQRGLSDAAEALIKTRVLKSVATQSGQALQLTDPAILQTWLAYANWMKEDMPFLQWRQSINAAARSWSLASRRESDLLREDSLEEARNYLQLRTDELNDDERQYISASVEADDRRRTMEQLSRANQDALQAQIAHLKDELSASRKPELPVKRKYVVSWGLVLVLLAVVFLAMAAVMYVLRVRDQAEQDRKLAEQQTTTKNEMDRQIAAAEEANRRLSEQLAERNRVGGTSSPVKSRVIAPVDSKDTGSVPNAKPSSKPSGNLMNAAPSILGTDSAARRTCHILSPAGGNSAPGRLSISFDGEPLGSIAVGKDGSGTALDFPCKAGNHSFQMQLKGAPVCRGTVTIIMASENYFHAFYRTSGTYSECNMERVAASAK